jgi:formylglycine-generating enzyme required for sulfatase activity
MLTNKKPFWASSDTEIMDRVKNLDPIPPRQLDDGIAKELERICQKALSKRACDRYSTAKDMAEDLHDFSLQEKTITVLPPHPPAGNGSALPLNTPNISTETGLPGTSKPSKAVASETQPVRIVPKGLRSFDHDDKDFFLELLPGPRDRHGLPDSIRFWKQRIECFDSDETFAVGVMYGPSGCGKSSLVKAGLFPSLSPGIKTIYVEATPTDTENRLLATLRKRVPNLPEGDLKETLASIRQGQGIRASEKVLIVLDQFEQWLHAMRAERNTPLAESLRQCAGGRLQCLLLVRVDFSLATSRFMRELEILQVEGQNSSVVDLFDEDHARHVLAAFGRAFGKLPEKAKDTTDQQKAFVKQAVAALAVDRKVVCVRLALFAEMMKGRPWTPASLRDVGGAEGIGETFLEETFNAVTAPPEHRRQQRAARGVLRSLLPEAGSDIKGNMRSEAELMMASGYAEDKRAFGELLKILDSETRLITPTDPEGTEPESSEQHESSPYFQLTHDYLVPSVRHWLTRKQRETRRGRAELRLAELAATWAPKRESRFLPAWWEWLEIRARTRRRDWTPIERAMMSRGALYHGMRAALLVVALGIFGAGAWYYRGHFKAVALYDTLVRASPTEVPAVIEQMSPYRRWLDPILKDSLDNADTDADPAKHLRLSLAALPSDPSQVDYLKERLLDANPQEFGVVRTALDLSKEQLLPGLWSDAENPATNTDSRFHASCALAAYAPDDPRWAQLGPEVAAHLITLNPLVLAGWQPLLMPVGKHLLPPLADAIAQESRGDTERRTLAALYKGFASAATQDAFRPLEDKLTTPLADGATLEGKNAWAKKKANVGAALVAMDRNDQVRSLLIHTPDPTVRSWLIERLGPGGADASRLASWLSTESDVSVRRALILAIGSTETDRLPIAERDRIAPQLLDLYRNDPDPGIHGAARWVLQRWGKVEKLQSINHELATGKPEGSRRWYNTRDGQTFVIVEDKGRRFAIAATETTVSEFQRFQPDHAFSKQKAPTPNCPVNQVSWYDAVAYCNWLSEREAIPKEQSCYERNDVGKYGEGMLILADRIGYRLPNEAEWELACRAGAATLWSCGNPDDYLLSKYARFFENSRARGISTSSPVATYKPNDLGLFDMHGNVAEWCQDLGTVARGIRVGAIIPDQNAVSKVAARVIRAARSGVYYGSARDVALMWRSGDFAENGADTFGFRVMRCLP